MGGTLPPVPPGSYVHVYNRPNRSITQSLAKSKLEETMGESPEDREFQSSNKLQKSPNQATKQLKKIKQKKCKPEWPYMTAEHSPASKS